jgi:hypothetical protein
LEPVGEEIPSNCVDVTNDEIAILVKNDNSIVGQITINE